MEHNTCMPISISGLSQMSIVGNGYIDRKQLQLDKYSYIHHGFKYQKNRVRGETIFWCCWWVECRNPLKTNLFDFDDQNVRIDPKIHRNIRTPTI